MPQNIPFNSHRGLHGSLCITITLFVLLFQLGKRLNEPDCGRPFRPTAPSPSHTFYSWRMKGMRHYSLKVKNKSQSDSLCLTGTKHAHACIFHTVWRGGSTRMRSLEQRACAHACTLALPRWPHTHGLMYYWNGKIPREHTVTGSLPKSPAAFVPKPELNQHEVLPPLICSQPLSVILPQNTLSLSASPLSCLSSPSLSPSVFLPPLPLFSPAQGTDTWIQDNMQPTQLLKGHKPAQNTTPIHTSANTHPHGAYSQKWIWF